MVRNTGNLHIYFAPIIDLFGKVHSINTVIVHWPKAVIWLVEMLLSNEYRIIRIQAPIVRGVQNPDWESSNFQAYRYFGKNGYHALKLYVSWLKGKERRCSQGNALFMPLSIFPFPDFNWGYLLDFRQVSLLIMLAGLLVSGFYLKKTSKLASRCNRVQSTFHQISKWDIKNRGGGIYHRTFKEEKYGVVSQRTSWHQKF